MKRSGKQSGKEVADDALLHLIVQGNEDALAALYDRYGKLAYSLAYRMLGDTHGAEDVVQEAFINVWRKANSYVAKRGTARTWLLAVVHHSAVDLCRRRRGKIPAELPLEWEELIADPNDLWSQVSNNLDREELTGCLARIPKEQREAIELAYFSGYSQREIAEIKDVPLGTVKGRIRIGMEKLRDLLVQPEIGDSDHGPR
jgi:RNA polymerase sigma-70 factor (ECF subfamily)